MHLRRKEEFFHNSCLAPRGFLTGVLKVILHKLKYCNIFLFGKFMVNIMEHSRLKFVEDKKPASLHLACIN